jgi:hypothetical protein
MKRWTLRIFVFLLLGAIVNVAVAWTVSLQINLWDCADVSPWRPPEAAGHNDHALLLGLGQSMSDKANLLAAQLDSFGYRRRDLFALTTEELTPGDGFVSWGSPCPVASHFRFGWPLRSMQGWLRRNERLYQLAEAAEFDGDFNEYRCMWRVHLDESQYPPIETRLPVGPIWPGFAINTVFYAAVLWMLFALGGTPFALRKWRRIRRGLCAKCGYDLRGSTSQTCPECGGPTRYDDAS